MRDKDRLMLTSLFIAVAIVGAVGTSVLAILNLTRQVHSRGRIVVVTPPPPPELKFNVFEDENCTVVLSEIDWGSFDPGESKSLRAFVKNYGDVPFTMALSTANWNPAESETYITPSWDYANQKVSVGEVLPVAFTLTVDQSIENSSPKIESFSFDIVITAVEA